MTYEFTVATRIAAPVADAFDLSLDVDAHIASTPGSREQAIDGVTEGQLTLGDAVTWKARHFGIWWRMTNCIVEHDRPASFVDQQTSGPFAYFRHEHWFKAVDEGTEMIDRVRLAAPLGVLGRSMERWLVGPYIKRLIVQRNEILKRLLENSR